MRTVFLLFSLLAFSINSFSQNVATRLATAIKHLEADSQMENAIVGFQVVKTSTGELVYGRNDHIGFAAASSQKVITAATAFDIVGSNYRFKTSIGYDGSLAAGVLTGNLYVSGTGDPTLGSDRYASTKPNTVITKWVAELKKAGITAINGNIYLHSPGFSLQATPGGWIWDDIGNYYGAGHWGLNWHENQYDLVMRPGASEGDTVAIIKTDPPLQNARLINMLLTGKKGSGDHAYIYLPPYSNAGFVTGTVPAGEKQFTISGSFPNPAAQIQYELSTALSQAGIKLNGRFINDVDAAIEHITIKQPTQNLFVYESPALDSIVYWFLKRSINLYGEALLKAVALEKTGAASTSAGLTEVFQHWQKIGIDSNAINMADGSGLSPQNRITADAFVRVMRYAQGRPWFRSFYNALPEYNSLKMKSGTIGGAKSFTGYVKSSSGTDYTFAIIINNYNGRASQIVSKMYKVLDVLK